LAAAPCIRLLNLLQAPQPAAGTGLYELWKHGLYRNYHPDKLVDLVARILALLPPWVRVYRIQVRCGVGTAGFGPYHMVVLVIRLLVAHESWPAWMLGWRAPSSPWLRGCAASRCAAACAPLVMVVW